MTADQVVRYFGTKKAAAEFLGITTAAIHQWNKRGMVPLKTQCLLEVRTKGQLKAEVAHQKTQRRRIKK